MTVAPTNTAELNIGELVLAAYQQAGLMDPSQAPSGSRWDDRARFARGALQRILQGLQAEGPFVREVEQYTLTLTAGQASYNLPADTLDVVEQGTYRHDVSTVIESTLRQIDREEWTQSADKTTEATPMRFWVNRSATISLNFLPVPDTTGAIVRIQRQRCYADASGNQYTPDLERYWSEFLVWELAHAVALSATLPIDRCMYFKGLAKEAKAKCKQKSVQQVPSQLYLNHPTGWTR